MTGPERNAARKTGGPGYSVLVVSAAPKFNEALRPMLPASGDAPVCFVSNVAAARRELLNRAYDFVILNAPLPDDWGIRFAMEVSGHGQSVVLLLVGADRYEEIDAMVTSRGVFTLQKPMTAQTLRQALHWMASARERLRSLERRAVHLENQLEEIRLVNRAKWILIAQQGMTEPEAHRRIEKQAMDRCVTKGEIALEIIRDHS